VKAAPLVRERPRRAGRPRKDPLGVFTQPAAIPLPVAPYEARESDTRIYGPHREHDERSLWAPGAPLPYCDRTGKDTIWECPGSGRLWRMVQSCDRLDCATCYPRLRARRGKRLFGRMGGGAALGAWVFTVPHELRAVLGLEQLAVMRQRLARMVQLWASLHWRCEIGLVVCTHPTGDVCGRCRVMRSNAGIYGRCTKCNAPPRWLPHFDVLMPMMGLRHGQPFRLPYHFRQAPGGGLAPELVALRRGWAWLCAEVVQATGRPLKPETAALLAAGRAGMDYRFRLQRRQKRHRLAYSARPFPAYQAAAGAALQPRPYGLAAPGTGRVQPTTDQAKLEQRQKRHQAVTRWRDAVAGRVDEEHLVCTCCVEPQRLVMVDIVRRGHRDGERFYAGLPYLRAGP